MYASTSISAVVAKYVSAGISAAVCIALLAVVLDTASFFVSFVSLLLLEEKYTSSTNSLCANALNATVSIASIEVSFIVFISVPPL